MDYKLQRRQLLQYGLVNLHMGMDFSVDSDGRHGSVEGRYGPNKLLECVDDIHYAIYRLERVSLLTLTWLRPS